MPAPIYADPAAWQEWSGQDSTPDDFVQLLRTASRAIRTGTALWRYQVDEAGLPADSDLLQAFCDATCAQITALIALEVDPDAGGTLDTGFESSVKLGSAQLTYTGVEAVMAARQATVQGLCPDAISILQQALQLAAVTVFG